MLMRQMRQNTKIIMILAVVAFVSLMVFEWGMDMSGRTAGGTLGRVGGTTVTALQFQNSYRVLYEQVQAGQDQPITSQQNREIEDLAWDQVVNQILIRDELARRGIRVTEDEIIAAARMSPPPEFQFDPAFQNQDGQFDLTLYQQFLSQADPLFLQQLEIYYGDLLMRNKLIRQVTSGIFVSDEDLWDRWRAENERVSVVYLSVSPDTRVPDGEVEVSEDEIVAYYQENEDDFAVPASAGVRYAFIDKSPTAADTAATFERAVAIRQEILDGADFAAVAERESGDPGSAAAGGSLGTVPRGIMVPQFDSVAFSIPTGQLSEPFRSGFGFHVVEVLSRDDELEEVEARHILLPIERTDESEVSLLTRADSIENLAENQTLDSAASSFGLEVLEGEITEDFSVLAGAGLAGEGQDWAFEEAEGVGSVSPVFENDDSFYLMEITSLERARVLTLDEVRDEIRDELRIQAKTELALEAARGWAGEIRQGNVSLEELAERISGEVQTAGPFSRVDFVPGLGQLTPAIGAAFGAPVGTLAGPALAFESVVLLRVEERVEADREAWEAQKETQRSQVSSTIQQARLDQWIEGLKETTRIIDNRAEYFQAIEEQAEQGPQMPMFF